MATYIIYNEPDKLKIGATRKKNNKQESLRRRYQTSIGKDVNIEVFISHYPFVMEKKIHNFFANKKNSLEIYNVQLEEAKKKILEIQEEMKNMTIDMGNFLRLLPFKIIDKILIDNKIPAIKDFEHIAILDIINKPVSDVLNNIKADTYKEIAKKRGLHGKNKMDIMEELLTIK